MTPIDIAQKVLELGSEKKGLHITGFVQRAVQFGLVQETDAESFQKKLSAALAQNVKNREPLFRKVRVDGRKKGCYGLYTKSAKVAKVDLVTDEVNTPRNFLGKAGEYAVFSELLFRGFNASIMTIDDGIDVIASKGHRFFYLQVKTSSDHGLSFVYTVRKSAFTQHHAAGTFYILVARRNIASRYLCDFVILPSSQIDQMIQRGKVQGKDSYSLKLSITETGQFILNGEEVTAQVNRFNQIV